MDLLTGLEGKVGINLSYFLVSVINFANLWLVLKREIKRARFIMTARRREVTELGRRVVGTE
jgi:hypothetical protein